jgi:hypothetical protein
LIIRINPIAIREKRTLRGLEIIKKADSEIRNNLEREVSLRDTVANMIPSKGKVNT